MAPDTAAPATAKVKVWWLTIEDRHGTGTTLFSSQAGIYAHLRGEHDIEDTVADEDILDELSADVVAWWGHEEIEAEVVSDT